MVAGLGACGTPFLEGSLGEVYDLAYTEIRVRLAPEDLALQYVLRATEGSTADGGTLVSEGFPFRIRMAITNWVVDGGLQGGVPIGFQVRRVGSDEAFTWDAGGIPSGVNIDLTQENHLGAQRGTYTHVDPASQAEVELPRASRAELYFDRAPEPGKPVKGNFHVTFVRGVEAGSGRTVFGAFDVKEVQ